MTDHDKTAFVKLLVGLAEYYGKPISETVIGIYWAGLRHHDLEAIRDAMNRHARHPDSGQWMPKVADLERLIDGSTQDAAYLAWTKVERAVMHVGPWRDMVFDDALIHRVLYDMGGWIALGEKTEKDWPFVGREFVIRYRGYVNKGGPQEYEPVLTGLANLTNQAVGQRLERPVLFGQHKQCLTVMAGGSRNSGKFEPDWLDSLSVSIIFE
ncbi:DUF6475 domain-containing protein [Gammaproteobacteria bacterium]